MMVYGIEGDGDGIKAVYLGDPQKGQFFSPQGALKMELKHPVFNRHSGLANKKIITIRPVGKYDCVDILQQQRSRTRRSCCFASQVHNGGGLPNDADAVVNLEYECQMYNLTRLPPERHKIMAKVGLLKDVADWSNTGEVVSVLCCFGSRKLMEHLFRRRTSCYFGMMLSRIKGDDITSELS